MRAQQDVGERLALIHSAGRLRSSFPGAYTRAKPKAPVTLLTGSSLSVARQPTSQASYTIRFRPLHALRTALSEWGELARFRELPPKDRDIVFYSEGEAYWPHLGPIIDELTGKLGKSICYLSSSTTDPVLRERGGRIKSFYVGSGTARTQLFKTLDAKIMVMTLTDLGNYQIKRSRNSVHYVYVFHSINSIHTAYRQGSFDYYDTILCVGPYHREELRAIEALNHLPEKTLVDHGYGRLDSLMEAMSVSRTNEHPNGNRRVLLAPTWGHASLLETHGVELVELLLNEGFDLTVRPHPMTKTKKGSVVAKIVECFGDRSNFKLDTDMNSMISLQNADVLITDWSGVSLEYAFGFERPVLFFDVPRKFDTPEYHALVQRPIEERLRSEIGVIVAPGDLGSVSAKLNDLFERRDEIATRARELRSRDIFNLGASGAVGAAYIAALADRKITHIPTSEGVEPNTKLGKQD